MRRTVIWGAIGAVAAFTAVSLFVYDFRPTAGTVVLSLGWMSILATGYFLFRAASSFDLRVGSQVVGNLTLDRRNELEREKRLLIKAIKECEFDRDSGKLEAAEAEEAITRYRARAVEILQTIDHGPVRQYEGLIEKELQRRLEANQTDPRACAACTSRNDVDAAFCKKCGAKL